MAATQPAVLNGNSPGKKKEPLALAFFWLGAFYFVYCGRPQDWFKILSYIPLAKLTGILAMLSLLFVSGKTPRKFKDVPREGSYLLAMIGLMFLSGFLSPVWRGGAVAHAMEFSKVYVAWILTFLLITTITRLRRIIFIQAFSVATISAIAIIRGRHIPRLNGAVNGIYSNPNDLAFAIVLCIPLVVMFFVSAKGMIRKSVWVGLMLSMMTALILTASRAGFINLLVSGSVCLWHFGVKGKRFYLIVLSGLTATILLVSAGGTLQTRLLSITEGMGTRDEQVQNRAYESFQERKFLIEKAVEGILHYPILGVGGSNFGQYSGAWKQVHMSYLQIGVEGGVPMLILYLLFFRRGFNNLKVLRKRKDLDGETKLLVGALHSMLVGFALGACFAPEAYQFFPYFTVCYTSVLFAIVREREAAKTSLAVLPSESKSYSEIYGTKTPGGLVPAR